MNLIFASLSNELICAEVIVPTSVWMGDISLVVSLAAILEARVLLLPVTPAVSIYLLLISCLELIHSEATAELKAESLAIELSIYLVFFYVIV